MTVQHSLDKLASRFSSIAGCLCIGLDSDMNRVPKRFLQLQNPQFEFNKWIIDQTHQYAVAYKTNTAFYEARGVKGWEDMALTQAYLRERHPSIVTIADAKRADIGNTNNGYVTAFFDELQFDAITLHPYLGKEALQPFLDRTDKLCIILCKTSNPGSGEIQDVLVDGVPLWKKVAKTVAHDWNHNNNCMVVVGATYPEILTQVRAEIGDMWMLVPGVGEQGGDIKTVLEAGATQTGGGLLINSSRGVIFSSNPSDTAKKLVAGV